MKATSIFVESVLWAGASVILACAGTGAFRSGSAGGAPRPASTREPLSASVRAALHARMAGHGEQMTRLSMDVITLHLDEAGERAHEIANEPKMARAYGGDLTSVNAEVPQAFFAFQENLGKRAAAVEAAAAARDEAALAAAYGRLAEACVACHAWYLPPNP